MTVDTLTGANGTATESKKGRAKEILADAASIEAYKNGAKNVQISVSGHPALYGSVIETLARDEKNLEVKDGKTLLKRNAYSNAVRHALMEAFDYHGKPMIPSGRGTAGLISLFQDNVRGMFELVRSVGQLGGTSDDQIKPLAFEKARQAVRDNPQLASVDVTDELLEALWSGEDVELEIEDDDDDDDVPEPATEPVAPAPTFGG